MIDIDKFQDRAHADYFHEVISEINKQLEYEIFDYITENTNVRGRENVFGVREHRTDSSIGFQCRIGGDWEDPAEFILFVNEEGEVWIRILHEGNSESQYPNVDYTPEDRFNREVEMMTESPVLFETGCLGKISLDEFDPDIPDFVKNN